MKWQNEEMNNISSKTIELSIELKRYRNKLAELINECQRQ
jgi:hypothetical protein